MTAAVITYSNIYSQPSINIFSILDTRANVVDPKDASGARKFVYDSDPFQKAFDFSGIPYIICADANIDFPANKGADGKKQYLTWSQRVVVRTVKDGSSGSRTDAGITDMRAIVDDIVQSFNDATIKTTLRIYEMYNVDCAITNVDSTVVDQKVIYETTIEITYSTRLAVTA